jgi:hypothetical protein
MKKIIIAFFLMPLIISPGQNLDSLYNKLVEIKNHTGVLPVKQKNVTSTGIHDKCLTSLVNEVKLNIGYYSPEKRMVIQSILQRPSTDTSIVTPSGKFRIHYNKTGDQAPAYDVNLLAIAADSSYNYEINILDYPPPPPDSGDGGDNRYDIYIQYLGDGQYAWTESDRQITPNTSTSFIVMDNSFAGESYYTNGIDAARVTIAHEFHHGIQFGNYIYRLSDTFYHELTSTSMETFVFNSIHDYYQYLPSYFNYTQLSFSRNSGYNLAIWNIFLRDQLGANVIKRSWELMPTERALNAISEAIQEAGSTFKTELNLFGQWTYFTGSRAFPGSYFKDAANYPLVSPAMLLNLSQSPATLQTQPMSNNFIVLTAPASSGTDTLVSIITNSDIANGVSNPYSDLQVKYSLTNSNTSGFRNITGNYYSQMSPGNNLLLSESDIYNKIPVNGGQPVFNEITYVYPQPFRYSKNNYLYFPAEISSSGTIDLYIYSIDMNLIYFGKRTVVPNNKVIINWNGFDNKNRKLATGVYIYLTDSGGTIKKGKFVVFNE